jgi:hypothetical protein
MSTCHGPNETAACMVQRPKNGNKIQGVLQRDRNTSLPLRNAPILKASVGAGVTSIVRRAVRFVRDFNTLFQLSGDTARYVLDLEEYERGPHIP